MSRKDPSFIRMDGDVEIHDCVLRKGAQMTSQPSEPLAKEEIIQAVQELVTNVRIDSSVMLHTGRLEAIIDNAIRQARDAALEEAAGIVQDALPETFSANREPAILEAIKSIRAAKGKVEDATRAAKGKHS